MLEVLCSGEPTAGKLLMHFLLFYGRHYDALNMCVDVTAPSQNAPSPFLHRKPGGTIDPYSGMLTVDPIVVYDPLEGAEGNNVARSCFAWQSIRWAYGQCFNTLTNTVERMDSGVADHHRRSSGSRGNGSEDIADGCFSSDNSPLLELLLSY